MAIASSGSKPIDLKSPQGQRLKNIIAGLATAANIPMPKIYVMNEKAINAFATGRSPDHASVSVTTGALEKLNDNELSGVLAHELTHIKNRDILVMTIVVSLAGILTFFIRMFSQVSRGSKKSPISAIFGLILVVLAPLAVSLIRAAVSRKREYMADAGGAIITHNPQGLADALEKIKLYSQPMKKKSLNTSHLFISSPYRADIAGIKLGFLENLFANHPPLDERIAILRGQKKID
jgi:heat shock protein HtpX